MHTPDDRDYITRLLQAHERNSRIPHVPLSQEELEAITQQEQLPPRIASLCTSPRRSVRIVGETLGKLWTMKQTLSRRKR